MKVYYCYGVGKTQDFCTLLGLLRVGLHMSNCHLNSYFSCMGIRETHHVHASTLTHVVGHILHLPKLLHCGIHEKAQLMVSNQSSADKQHQSKHIFVQYGTMFCAQAYISPILWVGVNQL